MQEKRILVVDDSPTFRKVICDHLEDAGYIVRGVSNALEGLAIIAVWIPHLVILDYDIPGMNGLEAMLHIKEKEIDSDVMFVSGQDNIELIRECLENGADDFVRKPFSILELVTRVAVRFRILELRNSLENANKRLREINDRDDLTGLLNMRALYREMNKELARSLRTGSYVGCIMLDLDNFKRVNDSHDHLFGSHVIKEVGAIIADTVRGHDSPARFGGDEFVIMLTEVTEDGIKMVSERIRSLVGSHLFTDGVSKHEQTVSVGFAITTGKNVHEANELIRAADNALYTAKDSGRNTVFGRNANETVDWIVQTRELRKAG